MTNTNRSGGEDAMPNRDQHLTEDELNQYIDGDLTPGARQFADAHLGTCTRCRATIDDLRAISSILHSLPQAQVPRSLQLGPEYARKPTPIRGGLAAWLLPALPAIRAATLALALGLASVTAYRVAQDQPDSGPRQENGAALVVSTSTAPMAVATGSTFSAFSVATQPAEPAPIVPTETAALLLKSQSTSEANPAGSAPETAAEDGDGQATDSSVNSATSGGASASTDLPTDDALETETALDSASDGTEVAANTISMAPAQTTDAAAASDQAPADESANLATTASLTVTATASATASPRPSPSPPATATATATATSTATVPPTATATALPVFTNEVKTGGTDDGLLTVLQVVLGFLLAGAALLTIGLTRTGSVWGAIVSTMEHSGTDRRYCCEATVELSFGIEEPE